MKAILHFALLLLLALPLAAAEPGRVLLFGTFHFQDAGLDVVKLRDLDVMSTKSQAYLQELSERLSGFRPTKVVLEYAPEEDAAINQSYSDYLAGTFELPANEIYQLGFRIAKAAGHARVYSFDNRDVEWQAEAMFEYAIAHDSAEMNAFNQIIQSITEDEAQARATLSLAELLRRANDSEQERRNMDLYLATNAIGAGDGYAGATASASWWARNFRMYANIQKAAAEGERIIAIGGAGHMAILKQLLEIDGRLEREAVEGYF